VLGRGYWRFIERHRHRFYGIGIRLTASALLMGIGIV
jgi:hypothetical protein